MMLLGCSSGLLTGIKTSNSKVIRGVFMVNILMIFIPYIFKPVNHLNIIDTDNYIKNNQNIPQVPSLVYILSITMLYAIQV